MLLHPAIREINPWPQTERQFFRNSHLLYRTWHKRLKIMPRDAFRKFEQRKMRLRPAGRTCALPQIP